MKLKLANKEDRDNYWAMAKTWSAQQDWAYYQKDTFAAEKGIAEWLANQNGETCFESFVGRKYKRIRG